MDRIKIGGKDRPIVFKMSTLASFIREENVPMSDMMNMDILSSMSLVYHGLKSGAKKSGLKVDFTKDDVFDWLDEDGFSENSPFNQAMAVFAKSLEGFSEKKDSDDIDISSEKN